MLRAALVFSMVSFGAMAQTPADLARLAGTADLPASVSVAAPVAQAALGGGGAADLARLAPVTRGVNAAPATAASGGAFAAADLARASAAGVATWRVAPDVAVAAK